MSHTKKTLLSMLGMALVAGGLGTYAYVWVYQADLATAAKRDHEVRLLGPHWFGSTPPDAGGTAILLTKLTVTMPDGSTTLTRAPGQAWRLVAPLSAKADPQVVESLIGQLETARFKSTVEENPDSAALTTYGLRPPAFVVEAEGADGSGLSHRVTLEGGVENPFDGSVYMRRSGDEAVYQVPGGVRWGLAKSTFELRAKDIFALPVERLRTVTFTLRNNRWALERQPDKSWKLTAPNDEAADAAAVNAWLGALTQERAQAFPELTPQVRAGFDRPVGEVSLQLDSGPPIQIRLLQRTVAQTETTLALSSDGTSETLLEVSAGLLTHLDKSPTDLRDKSVLRFDRERVFRMVIRHRGGEVTVEKPHADAGADSWLVVGPQRGPAKTFRVTSALWTLGALRWTRLEAERPTSWGPYGLDKATVEVALFDSSGTLLGQLVLGRPLRDAPQSTFVRGTGNRVLVIDNTRLADFPFSVEDLLDRPAAPSSP